VKDDEAPERGSRDLVMESHFMAIGFWYRVFGVMTFLSAAFLILTSATKGGGIKEAVGGEFPIVFVLLFSSVLQFSIGHYMSKFSNSARLFCIFALVIALAFTVWSIANSTGGLSGIKRIVSIAVPSILVFFSLSMIYALSIPRAARVCRKEYLELLKNTPDQKSRPVDSPFFYGFMIIIVAGIAGNLILVVK